MAAEALHATPDRKQAGPGEHNKTEQLDALAALLLINPHPTDSPPAPGTPLSTSRTPFRPARLSSGHRPSPKRLYRTPLSHSLSYSTRLPGSPRTSLGSKLKELQSSAPSELSTPNYSPIESPSTELADITSDAVRRRFRRPRSTMGDGLLQQYHRELGTIIGRARAIAMWRKPADEDDVGPVTPLERRSPDGLDELLPSITNKDVIMPATMIHISTR